ncbi:hypothetical protein [Nonomuraea sp. LPB2021202275-12-8]|uniref:hypothetical protein n=1 Tax=Nonomuraea sp. LPB2021202275-12-8 TaxID=3120159 RepID=UPI00300D0E8F
MLRIGERPWGVVSLFRMRPGAAFGPDEVALLASLSGPLADRLRRFARPSEPGGAIRGSAPGLLLFDEYGEATSLNEEARHYLALLPDGPSVPSALGLRLPIWVVGTALQARAIARGRDRGSARVRIRTVDGQWLTCHAFGKAGVSSRGELVARLFAERH